jgi:hypothetical protein
LHDYSKRVNYDSRQEDMVKNNPGSGRRKPEKSPRSKYKGG